MITTTSSERDPDTRAALVTFLGTIVRPGGRIEDVDDSVNLFDAGYLDSLAIIQIVTYLEQTHGLSLAGPGMDPTDLGTIGGILSMIDRAAS